MLQQLATLSNAESRSISPGNFTGEKGRGGMAEEGTVAACARDLGQGWKVSERNRISNSVRHSLNSSWASEVNRKKGSSSSDFGTSAPSDGGSI